MCVGSTDGVETVPWSSQPASLQSLPGKWLLRAASTQLSTYHRPQAEQAAQAQPTPPSTTLTLTARLEGRLHTRLHGTNFCVDRETFPETRPSSCVETRLRNFKITWQVSCDFGYIFLERKRSSNVTPCVWDNSTYAFEVG